MDSDLIRLAQRLRHLPLIECARVLGHSVTRPDEASVLELGLPLIRAEADGPAIQPLRHGLLAEALKHPDRFRPVLSVGDGLRTRLWQPHAASQKWAPFSHSEAELSKLDQGEPFLDWHARVLGPRLDERAEPKLTPVSAGELIALRARLVEALDPAWLEPIYRARWSADNPTLGFCALASEAAFFELGGGPAGWKSMAVREADGTSHWWLEHVSGVRFDPTDDQFRRQGQVPPYERGLTGKACPFMGMRQDPDSPWGFQRKPGLRAAPLLHRLRPEWGPIDEPAHQRKSRLRIS